MAVSELPKNLRASAPARHRRAGALGDRASAGRRRRLCRARPPGRQEAMAAARPHPDQPVLRELDAHPHLVRAGRQAARRRRRQHVGRRLVDQEGRDPDRHRDDPERDAPRRAGRAPSRQRRGRAARPPRQLRGDQRRRRQPRAPDPSAARRADHPAAQGHDRGPAGRDLRRRAALARRPLQHAAADRDGRPGPAGRAENPAAGRGRALRRRGRPRHGERPRRCRHRHDAAPADRAHAGQLRAVGARVFPPVRPDLRAS